MIISDVPIHCIWYAPVCAQGDFRISVNLCVLTDTQSVPSLARGMLFSWLLTPFDMILVAYDSFLAKLHNKMFQAHCVHFLYLNEINYYSKGLWCLLNRDLKNVFECNSFIGFAFTYYKSIKISHYLVFWSFKKWKVFLSHLNL